MIKVVRHVLNQDIKPEEINKHLFHFCCFLVLVKWCSESKVIFSMVTSVMNEILLRCSGESFFRMLLLIKWFLFSLSEKCQMDGKNVLDLYPEEFRHLMCLLRCKPFPFSSVKCESTMKCVLEQIVPVIQYELENKPAAMILLLSHIAVTE